MGRAQGVIFQRANDVGRGRPQDVARGRPSALNRGPNGTSVGRPWDVILPSGKELLARSRRKI